MPPDMIPLIIKLEGGGYLPMKFDLNSPADRLNESQLKRLEPYVLGLMECSEDATLSLAAKKLKVVALNPTQAAFELEGEENPSKLLQSIQEICRSRLTDQVTVPQYISASAPLMRHRVMGFEVVGQHLIVNYVQLGDNNFDVAMRRISGMYSPTYFKTSRFLRFSSSSSSAASTVASAPASSSSAATAASASSAASSSSSAASTVASASASTSSSSSPLWMALARIILDESPKK